MRSSPTALYACLAWLTLVLFVRTGLPFVRFPAFAFPDTGSVMALPIFLADGQPAEVSDYTDFAGVGPSDVDVVHDGVPSVVAHRFYELQRWIAEHPGAGGEVAVTVGLRVLRVAPDGTVHEEARIDGRGTARRR